MIKSIILNGFKSFVSETIELGNLTILTGLNSSGKSSVLQSILLIEKAIKQKTIYLEGHGNLNESVNSFSKNGLEIICNFDDDIIITIKDGEVTNKYMPDNFELVHIAADRFGPETSVMIDNTTNKLGKKGENIFRCIEVYADYVIPEIMRHPNSEGDTFLFNLRAWLGVISPNVKFEHFLQKMSDDSYSTFNGHRSKNVGFGLSYGLPIITALLMGCITNNCLILLENPEAHLHPRGQVELAELIALCVEAGAQIIVETHSDHLFDGIRVYAKESKTNFHEKIKGYWFELNKDLNTLAESIDIDENGRIAHWPAGMFDQFEINASKLL
jgi:predicted ATPase